jgi:hypothetical protein
MLNEKIKVDEKKYKEILIHKLSNLAKKSPCLLNYVILSDRILISDCFTDKQHEFFYNYMEDVKTTIFHIVEWLKKECHPVIFKIVRERRQLTKKEVEELIRLKKYEELDSSILNGGILSETRYNFRIDKMIIGSYSDGTPRDDIFLTDLKTGKMNQYSLSMPATLFLKQIRENLDSEYAYQKFEEVSVFVKEC